MSASAYVGRIGALAVGLGIGVAVAGMGSAAASPADSSSAGAGSDSSSARAGTRATAPEKRRGPSASTSIGAPAAVVVPARVSPPPDEVVVAESSTTSRSVAGPAANPPSVPGSADSALQPNSPTPLAGAPITVASTGTSPVLAGGPETAVAVAVPVSSDNAVAAADLPAAPLAVAAEPSVAAAIPQPLASVVANSPIPAAVAAEQPATQAATTESAVPQGLSNLVSSVLRLLSGGGPLAPAGAPAVWTLAAAARQEIDATAAAVAPAAAVTNSAPPTPAPAAAVPQPAASGPARGTATVLGEVLNVRNEPSTSGTPVAQYTRGMTFNYDSYTDANGYRWLSYISYSGVRRYVAQQTLDGKTVYVSGGVPLSSPPPPPPTPPPPTPTPTPKPTPTPAPAPLPVAPLTARKLLDKVPGDSNRIYAEKIVSGGATKMVVYISGVSGNFLDEIRRWGSPVFGTWAYGNPYQQVSKFIAQQDAKWKPSEIMLVGYSNGGMQAQAYAATAPAGTKSKIKTVVTFAAPLIKMSNEVPGLVLHIKATGDTTSQAPNKPGTVDSYAKNVSGNTKAIYWVDGNSHARKAYETAADSFDDAARTNSYWLPLRNSIIQFNGTVSEKTSWVNIA